MKLKETFIYGVQALLKNEDVKSEIIANFQEDEHKMKKIHEEILAVCSNFKDNWKINLHKYLSVDKESIRVADSFQDSRYVAFDVDCKFDMDTFLSDYRQFRLILEHFLSKTKIAMHCKTRNEAIEFCTYLDEYGKKWANRQSYKDKIEWNIFKENTCYDNEGTMASFSFYEKNGYTILEWSDFINEQEVIVGEAVINGLSFEEKIVTKNKVKKDRKDESDKIEVNETDGIEVGWERE